MGIDFLFVCNSLHRLEEVFNAGIFQYESLDTASDKFQNFFFHLFGTVLACNHMFVVGIQG